MFVRIIRQDRPDVRLDETVIECDCYRIYRDESKPSTLLIELEHRAPRDCSLHQVDKDSHRIEVYAMNSEGRTIDTIFRRTPEGV